MGSPAPLEKDNGAGWDSRASNDAARATAAKQVSSQVADETAKVAENKKIAADATAATAKSDNVNSRNREVITPTRGMNAGPPRLFQNHGVINIVLIEKTELESQLKMRKKLLKLMDQVIKNKKLRMMLRRMLPLLQLRKPPPTLLQPRKLPLLQKLKPLFNLNLKLTQALPTKRKLLTKLSTIRNKPDLRLPKRISLITSPPTRNIDPSTPSPSPKRELPLLNPKLTQA